MPFTVRGVRYGSGCHDRAQSTREAREQSAHRRLKLSSDSHGLHPPKMIATCVLSASYVVVMPKKRQALVEFEDVLGACNAVNYAADNQIYIAGHPAFVNYSTSQKISRPGDSDDSRSVNSVLLFTILNPIYSITTVRASSYLLRFSFCIVSLLPFLPVPFPLSQTDWLVPFHLWFLQDVLYTICNPCGPVQRIVIFRKNGVQAMVEYPLLGSGCSLRWELTGVRIFKQHVSPENLPCARCLHRAHGLLGGLVKQSHVNR